MVDVKSCNNLQYLNFDTLVYLVIAYATSMLTQFYIIITKKKEKP